MHNNKITVLASALILVLSACSQSSLDNNTKPQAQTPASSTAPTTSADNSQNALDWPGTYTGTLPCADCEGITTRISIDKNLRYTISETYLGKSDKPFLTEGAFTWNADGNSITLQGIAEGVRSTQFQIGENQIMHLDMNGKKIEGALAERYVLKKAMADGLTGSRWLLIELAGEAVSGTEESHFITFSEDFRVQAKAGCNNMNGSYQSASPGRIQFSKLAMTMMACVDMSQEQALAAALENADNYTMGKDTLSLNRARMAPLARFKLIP